MISHVTIFAQSFTESFETDGEGVRYESNNFTSECNADWFRRLQDGECATNNNANFRDLATNNAIGEDGTFYFGGSDVDQGSSGENPLGSGENAYLVMKTEAIIDGANSFQIVIKVAAEDDNNQFEGEERIFIEYAFDDDIAIGANCSDCLPDESNVNSGNYTTIGAFVANTSIDLYQADTDLDGNPDGSILSGTFVDYTYNFTTTENHSNLSIRIQLINQSSSEDGAFDHIRLTSNTVLPIELSSFTATKLQKSVHLEWKTETEINNDGFEIERSYSNGLWETLGFVKGSGSVQTPQEYQFVDSEVSTKTSYYRLKQIDFNGASSYSDIVRISNRKSDFFDIYPNPSSDYLNFRGDLLQLEETKVEIFSTEGVKVLEDQLNGSALNVSKLNSGLYFIRILSEGENLMMPFIKA